jgi:hypothetical protein
MVCLQWKWGDVNPGEKRLKGRVGENGFSGDLLRCSESPGATTLLLEMYEM